MANIDVDPSTINAIYKQRLAQVTDESILLSAAVTQLQNDLAQANRQIEALQKQLGPSTENSSDSSGE